MKGKKILENSGASPMNEQMVDDGKSGSTGSAEGGTNPTPSPSARQIDGVVIGALVGLRDGATPLVAFPGNPGEACLAARTTAALNRDDVGRQVALLFENGDPTRPLVIGCIQRADETSAPQAQPHAQIQAEKKAVAEVDRERVVLRADQEIVLRCGKASITLTRAGKVLIRGDYVLSRSSGVNRVKGGVVHIN